MRSLIHIYQAFNSHFPFSSNRALGNSNTRASESSTFKHRFQNSFATVNLRYQYKEQAYYIHSDPSSPQLRRKMPSRLSSKKVRAVYNWKPQASLTQGTTELNFPVDIHYQKKKEPRPAGHGEAWRPILDKLGLLCGKIDKTVEVREEIAPYDLVMKDGIPSWGSVIYIILHKADIIGVSGLLGKDISNIALALYPNLTPNNDTVRHALTTNRKFVPTGTTPPKDSPGSSGGLWRIATRVEMEKKRDEGKGKRNGNNSLNNPKVAKGLVQNDNEGLQTSAVPSRKRKASLSKQEADGLAPIDNMELMPVKRIKFVSSIDNSKEKISPASPKPPVRKIIISLARKQPNLEEPTPPVNIKVTKIIPLIPKVARTSKHSNSKAKAYVPQETAPRSKISISRSGRVIKLASKMAFDSPASIKNKSLVDKDMEESAIRAATYRREKEELNALPDNHPERLKAEAKIKYEKELRQRQAEFPPPDQMANDYDEPIPEWCERKRQQCAAEVAKWMEARREEARLQAVKEYPKYLERIRTLERVEKARETFREQRVHERELEKAERELRHKRKRREERLHAQGAQDQSPADKKDAEEGSKEKELVERYVTEEQLVGRTEWEIECDRRAEIDRVRRKERRALMRFLADPELKKRNIEVLSCEVTKALPSNHPYLRD